MDKKEKLILDMSAYFTKVHNKLGKLEKRAVHFGTGEKLFASELHTIQAVGKNGITATELCDLFGITKGAISQIISKLEKKGCILKERNKDYSKEINLSLTEKGWTIFNKHEELHHEMDGELLGFMETISEDQIKNFLEILMNIEKYVDKFSEK